jgi:stage III sporulation protein AA
MYKGIPQNDIGRLSDVISDVPKNIGIIMLIRSMAPQIIVCDEIGNKKDVEAIKIAFASGVKGIFTAHAANIQEVKQNINLNELIKEKIIKKIIVLDDKNKGQIKECIQL